MATYGKNVYLVKLGPKSFGDGRRTFARMKHAIWGQLLATKAEIIQSKQYFHFACKTEDFVIWNFCFWSLLKGIFNVLTRYYVWVWNTLTVINKIMFTSPEAMVEFPGEKKLKLSLSARQKPFYSLSRKTVNARENFWNVYCFATNQMRDETAKDNRQTAEYINHD